MENDAISDKSVANNNNDGKIDVFSLSIDTLEINQVDSDKSNDQKTLAGKE